MGKKAQGADGPKGKTLKMVHGGYDSKPLTETVLKGPVEKAVPQIPTDKKGYDGKPLSQTVAQNPPQPTAQSGTGQPATQGSQQEGKK